MIKYKILKGRGYDNMADPYWIEILTTKRFLFWKFNSRKVIGNYKMDDTYGELGDYPFFSLEPAEKRVKELKNI